MEINVAAPEGQFDEHQCPRLGMAEVARRSKEPDIRAGAMYHHILIPTDGSELSERAVTHGVALAKAHQGKITALHVTSPFHISALDPITVVQNAQERHLHRARVLASQHLAVVANAARAAGVDCDTAHVVHEHPYQAIIDTAAEKGCDLIAMASHGRHGVSAVILGSETAKVLAHSTIPVLVLR